MPNAHTSATEDKKLLPGTKLLTDAETAGTREEDTLVDIPVETAQPETSGTSTARLVSVPIVGTLLTLGVFFLQQLSLKKNPGSGDWQDRDTGMPDFDFKQTEIGEILQDFLDEKRAAQHWNLTSKAQKELAKAALLQHIMNYLAHENPIQLHPEIANPSAAANLTQGHDEPSSTHELAYVAYSGTAPAIGSQATSVDSTPESRPQPAYGSADQGYTLRRKRRDDNLADTRLVDTELSNFKQLIEVHLRKLKNSPRASFYTELLDTINQPAGPFSRESPAMQGLDALTRAIKKCWHRINQVMKRPTDVSTQEYNDALVMLRHLWSIADQLKDPKRIAVIDTYKKTYLQARKTKKAQRKKETAVDSFTQTYFEQVYPILSKEGIISTDRIRIHEWNDDDTFKVSTFSIAQVLAGEHLDLIERAQYYFAHFQSDNSGLADPWLTQLLNADTKAQFQAFKETRYGNVNAENVFSIMLEKIKVTPLNFNTTQELETIANAITEANDPNDIDLDSLMTLAGLQNLADQNRFMDEGAIPFLASFEHEIEKLLKRESGLLKQHNLNSEDILQADYFYFYTDGGSHTKWSTGSLAEVLSQGVEVPGLRITGRENVEMSLPQEFPDELTQKLLELGPEMVEIKKALDAVAERLSLLVKLADILPSLHQRCKKYLEMLAQRHGVKDIHLSDQIELSYAREAYRFGTRLIHSGPHQMTIAQLLTGEDQRLNPDRHHYSERKIVSVPERIPDEEVGKYLTLIADILTNGIQTPLMEEIRNQKQNEEAKAIFYRYKENLVSHSAPNAQQQLFIGDAPFLLIAADKILVKELEPSPNLEIELMRRRHGRIHVISLVTMDTYDFESPDNFRYHMNNNETLRTFVRGHYTNEANFDVEKIGLRPITRTDQHYEAVIDWEEKNVDAYIRSVNEGRILNIAKTLSDGGTLFGIAAMLMGPWPALFYTTILSVSPSLLRLWAADTDHDIKNAITGIQIAVIANTYDEAGGAVAMKALNTAIKKYAPAMTHRFLSLGAETALGQRFKPSLLFINNWHQQPWFKRIARVGTVNKDNDVNEHGNDENDDTTLLVRYLLASCGQKIDAGRPPLLIDNVLPSSANTSFAFKPVDKNVHPQSVSYTKPWLESLGNVVSGGVFFPEP